MTIRRKIIPLYRTPSTFNLPRAPQMQAASIETGPLQWLKNQLQPPGGALEMVLAWEPPTETGIHANVRPIRR
jgi:hypothetical protein